MRTALRVARNKSWRWRGAGEEEDGLREGGGIRNRQRDAPRNEGINHLKVATGRGDVGVGFAGELYCRLCTHGGWGRSKAAKQTTEGKTSPIRCVYNAV